MQHRENVFLCFITYMQHLECFSETFEMLNVTCWIKIATFFIYYLKLVV